MSQPPSTNTCGDYRGCLGLWGEGMYPYAMVPGHADERERHHNDDSHLRSCLAVTGYHLQATDGEIGHVSGFLVDDESWAIRYLIVDTSNWWMGYKMLVAPPWSKGVHWSDQTVAVDLSRESIRNAPAYDSMLDWSREQELNLYRHHGRGGYWAGILVG